MSLSEIKRLIAIPDDYLVISSDRHPYEKVVTMTYFRLRNKGVNEAAFVRELEKVIDSGKYRNIVILACITIIAASSRLA